MALSLQAPRNRVSQSFLIQVLQTFGFLPMTARVSHALRRINMTRMLLAPTNLMAEK